MGEEFCSEEVCSSVLEFSKGVLEQVFEEFEDAELERQYELLHTSSLQNSSPIPFNGHVINAPANKWSLRAPWAPKLYHCEIERRIRDRDRSRGIRIRIRLGDRSRIRLRDRSRIRLKETEVVIDCYIETGFGNNLLPFAFADFCLIWRSIQDTVACRMETRWLNASVGWKVISCAETRNRLEQGKKATLPRKWTLD